MFRPSGVIIMEFQVTEEQKCIEIEYRVYQQTIYTQTNIRSSNYEKLKI